MKEYRNLIDRDRYAKLEQTLDEWEQQELVRRGVYDLDDVLDGESLW